MASTCISTAALSGVAPAGNMEMPWQSGGEVDLREQVVQLQAEKQQLQDYAERVTRELRRYQHSRPPPAAKPEDDAPLPPWTTNMQMMSPLLFAYEERIGELEAVIERSVALAEQVQALTKENDTLRVELHERTVQVRNQQVIAPFRDLEDKEKPDEVQELYRLSVEQNEALAQQNQLLKLQLERMQQSVVAIQQQAKDVQVRAVDEAKAFTQEQERASMALRSEQERAVMAMRAEHEQAARQHRAEEDRLKHELGAERAQERQEHQRAEVFARQRSAAELRLDEVTGELVEEVRTREELEAQVVALQQENQHQFQSLEFYKKSFDDRCAIAGEEEERMQSDLARISHNERELRHRCAKLERGFAEATEQLGTARREKDAMTQEAHQMLPLIESMDARLRDLNEKYKRAQGELHEREGQVGELTLARDALSSTEAVLKRQAERQELRLQTEIDTLRSQRDREAEELRERHRRSASELEDRLRRSEQTAAELLAKAELAEKQRAWEAAALQQQHSLHTVERERLNADLEEMQQVRLRVERQADSAQQEARRCKADADAMSSEARQSVTQVSSNLASYRAKLHATEHSLAQEREKMQACEARCAGASSEHSRLRAQLQEEQRKASDLVEQERQRAQAEQRGFERQLRTVQTRARQDEQRAVELLHSQEALRQREQAESGLERESLEAQVERLARENRTLKEKSRTVLKTLAMRRSAGSLADDSF